MIQELCKKLYIDISIKYDRVNDIYGIWRTKLYEYFSESLVQRHTCIATGTIVACVLVDTLTRKNQSYISLL